MAVVYSTMMVVCEFLQEIDAAGHYEKQIAKEISIVVDGEKKKQLQDLGHTSYWTGAATPAHNPGKRIFYARDLT